MAIEKDIPTDEVFSLKDILGEDDPDFKTTEDLVSSHLLSSISERVEWTLKGLSALWGVPVEVVTMSTRTEVYAYITLNGVPKYLFVGCYPNSRAKLEPALSPEEIECHEKCGK